MFRFHDSTPIAFDDALPASVDVAIIGAGVIGITTAWFLRKRGLSVLVCDKGRVAAEQSSRNWGWVRVTARDPDEVPIAIDSVGRWEAIAAEIGEDIGFTRQGVLSLAASEAEMAEYEVWRDLARAHNLETVLFSKSDIGKFIDVPSGDWYGGMVTPSDARAEPFKAVPALARAARANGVMIREQCAVRTIDIEAGTVAGIVTEAGRIRASRVVCAAGVWSTMFLSNIGVQLPQLAVKGTVVRTEAIPPVFEGAAGLHDVYIRRRQDGGYTVASGLTEHVIGANSFRFLRKFLPSLGSASDIAVRLGRDATQQGFAKTHWGGDDTSPFESHRVMNPAPSPRALAKIRRNLARRVPELADVPFVEAWAGMIDATPDVVPVMDAIASHPGLFLATGFSGHGFGIGPGAGRVMAGLVTGEAPQHNLSRFRFSRFADGSKVVPGPAI